MLEHRFGATPMSSIIPRYPSVRSPRAPKVPAGLAPEPGRGIPYRARFHRFLAQHAPHRRAFRGAGLPSSGDAATRGARYPLARICA